MSILDRLARLWRQWTCQHDFRPLSVEHVADYTQDQHEALVERCQKCGCKRAQTRRILPGVALVFLAGSATAAEVKVCANPHPPVDLVSVEPQVRDLSALASTLDAGGILVLSGPSTASNFCGPFKNTVKALRGWKVVCVSAFGVATREWADPLHTSWVDAKAKILKVGPLADVAMWVQLHTVTYGPTLGYLTPAMVTATMQNALELAPNIQYFLNTDHTDTSWAWNMKNGQPIGDGKVVKHPNMDVIANDGVVLAGLAQTYSNVGYEQLASVPLDCRNIVEDGIHLSSKAAAPWSGAQFIGGLLAQRVVELVR